jgi:hypothetical protein
MRDYNMSMFLGSYEENKAIGEFVLPEYKTHFEYRISTGDVVGQGTWGIDNGFIHEIAVCDGSVRFANVKKTVAYVVVDQDMYGEPVVEKWNIKHSWKK